MNWKEEAIARLQRYPVMLHAVQLIPRELERLELEARALQSGAGRGRGKRNLRAAENQLLDNMVRRQELEQQQMNAECWVDTTGQALMFLTDRERVKDLERWYVYGRRWVIAVHSVLGAALIVNTAYAIYTGEIAMMITNLIILALLELMRLRNYKVAVKLVMQRDAESNQGQPVELTMIVKEDIIRVEDPNGQGHDVPLSQMKWAVQTKKMVVLCTKGKVLYQLPNDTFTQGTAEELIAYLRSKGIKS